MGWNLCVRWWEGEKELVVIHITMDPPSMLNSWQGVSTKASPIFLQKIPTLVVAKKFNFGFISPKHIVPKGYMFYFAYFRRLILCWGWRKGFVLATLPCRSWLFKVRCIFVLGTARPVPATFFLQLFCSDVWVLLSISHQVLGHSSWTFS